MKFPSNLGQDVAILRANHTVDVFFGKTGWDQHARFIQRKTHKGTLLTQTSGGKVPAYVFNQVLQKVQ